MCDDALMQNVRARWSVEDVGWQSDEDVVGVAVAR